MPLKLSSQDRKLFIGVAAVFLLLVAGALVLSGNSATKSEIPTTYSTGSDGAKAAYLLSQESGYKAVRWERSLSELPDPSGKILILAEPEEAATQADRNQLKKFITDGGRVVATGLFAAAYLPEASSVPDLVEGMLWKRVPALSPSAITRQAPEITLAPQAYWSRSDFAVPLYGDADHPRVVKYTLGKGEVI